MSRELTVKYPQVFEYTGIWMEDITHETRQGSSTFTLNSTNKLLKQYQWATGLKTDPPPRLNSACLPLPRRMVLT